MRPLAAATAARMFCTSVHTAKATQAMTRAKIPIMAPVEVGVGLPEFGDAATTVTSKTAYTTNATITSAIAAIVIVI
jgi:hypothetical protein